METYEYIEPDENWEPIVIRKTRNEILDEYYGHWCQQMRKVYRDHLINEDNCIDDWIVVHWATKIGE